METRKNREIIDNVRVPWTIFIRAPIRGLLNIISYVYLSCPLVSMSKLE